MQMKKNKSLFDFALFNGIEYFFKNWILWIQVFLVVILSHYFFYQIFKVIPVEYAWIEILIRFFKLIWDTYLFLVIHKFSLRMVRGEKVLLKDLFSCGKYLVMGLFAKLFFSIGLSIGLFFLIIPGIIFNITYLFIFILIVDDKAGAMDCFSKSAILTKKKRWELFFIWLLIFFPFYVLLYYYVWWLMLISPFAICIVSSAYLYLIREGKSLEN